MGIYFAPHYKSPVMTATPKVVTLVSFYPLREKRKIRPERRTEGVSFMSQRPDDLDLEEMVETAEEVVRIVSDVLDWLFD